MLFYVKCELNVFSVKSPINLEFVFNFQLKTYSLIMLPMLSAVLFTNFIYCYLGEMISSKVGWLKLYIAKKNYQNN